MYEKLSSFEGIIRIIQNSESISSAFHFSSGVTKTMSYGKDVFLSAEIFKKTLQNILPDEAIFTLLQAFGTNDGISLGFLTNRFSRYVGVAKNPIRNLEDFMIEIGIVTEEDRAYTNIAEEGINAFLPNN